MAFDVRGVAPLLGVHDMPTSVRFYRDTLGFQIVNTSPMLGEDYFHWALLRLGQAELMLNTNFESDEDRPSHMTRLGLPLTAIHACISIAQMWTQPMKRYSARASR